MNESNEMSNAADLNLVQDSFEAEAAAASIESEVKKEANEVVANASEKSAEALASELTVAEGAAAEAVNGEEAPAMEGGNEDLETEKEKADRETAESSLIDLENKKIEEIKKIEEKYAAKKFAIERKEVPLAKRRSIAFDLVERMREELRAKNGNIYMADADADVLIEEKFKAGLAD